MAYQKRKGLGKGINALFPDAANIEDQIASSDERVQEIALESLRPNPYQPRREFNDQALAELSQSIEQQGVLQPIIVRPSNENGYEIVAGERRFRASKQAGLKTIPAIVRALDEKVMMQVAILENLQREDLTPLEEADAYQLMMDKLSMTQEKVAKELGKSRSYIANHLRLRALPDEVKQLLQKGLLSMGQARTLLGLVDKSIIPSLAKRAVAESLTVRQLESLVAQLNHPQKQGQHHIKQQRQTEGSLFIKDLEQRLTDQLDRSVTIQDKNGHGKVILDYHSVTDLNQLLEHTLGLNITDEE